MFSCFLTNIIGIFVAFFAVIIAFYKWSFGYWKQKNVPYLPPKIPFGNLANPLRPAENMGVQVQHFYAQMRAKKWKHGGLFFLANPTYMVVDLEYVKNILTKDFQHFVDRGVYYNEDVDPIGAHLFALGGTKWRNLRTKLTPTFTSGKMKMMFQTLIDCESNLHKKIQAQKNKPIDIKDVLGCFTTDIIGSCAFGLDCNTFEDEDSPFRKYGKKVFVATPLERLKIAIFMNFPKVGRFFKMRQVSKDISDFYSKVVKDTVEYREKHNYSRKDFMQLLIDLKNDGNALTLDEITAQSFIFFLAGFETSSTTMTFALYELAKNSEVQEKVREEVLAVLGKHGGKITYEAIQDMKYMNQVLNETLRKYPPVPFITRQCIKEYKIPDQEIIIETGTRVIIPILGIHYDPEYYPDPQKFDPERFSEENVNKRHHYAHLPFGEGPRICIGLRFGLMQSKVGLASLLSKYRFKLNERTKQPMKFQVKSFVLAAEGEVWLDAESL